MTRTLRSANLETLNEQFKGIFEAHGPVPTRGLRATRRFALGAVFVYQLALLACALVFSASRRIGSAQYCSIARFDRHARQLPYTQGVPLMGEASRGLVWPQSVQVRTIGDRYSCRALALNCLPTLSIRCPRW